MKSREGAPEKQAFGLKQRTSSGSSWSLTRRVKGQLEVRYGVGATAFAACASIGWSLGELVETPVLQEQPE